jgi:hypothetical protein
LSCRLRASLHRFEDERRMSQRVEEHMDLRHPRAHDCGHGEDEVDWARG